MKIENPEVTRAIDDVVTHLDAWIDLLTKYVESLPPDHKETPQSSGNADRSYAEHELRAMKRDLGALSAFSTTRTPR